MGTIRRIRLGIGLDRTHMPSFIPGAKLIQGKLLANIGLFTGLPVSPATLGTYIVDVESAHLATKTGKGLIPIREQKIEVLWGGLEADCTFIQGLCRQNPEQGPALAAASGFKLVSPGDHIKGPISIAIEEGRGIAHLKANVAMFPPPSGKKSPAVTWLWRHTLDGKTIISDEPTPTGHTTIAGLPLGQEVNFGVAVKDSTATGQFCAWVPFFIH